MSKKSSKPAPTEPLSPAQVQCRLKEGDIILWPYRNNVESGNVLYTTERGAEIVWLNGYKSHNDCVPFDEVLSIADKAGPEHTISGFTGRGYITESGNRWNEANPSQ
ncbi:hypothetical protein LC612_38825 [Nostoc sp. CHAB 5834]|nr:hypothetical protein [Nostoc sp. CHAB 5834]